MSSILRISLTSYGFGRVLLQTLVVRINKRGSVSRTDVVYASATFGSLECRQTCHGTFS